MAIVRLMAVVAMLLASSKSMACSCGFPGVSTAYGWSDFAFTGRVKNVRNFEPYRYDQIEFEVNEVFKGKDISLDLIYTHYSGATCGFPFKEGVEYFVFGSIGGSSWSEYEGKPFVSSCSYTIESEKAPKYFEERWIEVREFLKNVENDS